MCRMRAFDRSEGLAAPSLMAPVHPVPEETPESSSRQDTYMIIERDDTVFSAGCAGTRGSPRSTEVAAPPPPTEKESEDLFVVTVEDILEIIGDAYMNELGEVERAEVLKGIGADVTRPLWVP